MPPLVPANSPRSLLQRLAPRYAIAGFITTLALHIAALTHVDLSGRAALLIFPPFLALAPLWMTLSKIYRYSFSLSLSENQHRWREVLDRRPPLQRWIHWCIVVYALVTVFVGFSRTASGEATPHEGGYAIMNHGTFIREITAEEYLGQRNWPVRMFSAWILMFWHFDFTLVRYAWPDENK